MPKKMSMYLQKHPSLTSPQSILYNTHANKPKAVAVQASGQKLLGPMIDRVSGVNPGCGSCGSRR